MFFISIYRFNAPWVHGRAVVSPPQRELAIDEETSERYAVILKTLRDQGTPIPTNDIRISASAMQYGLRIITTDSHFNKVPQVIVGLDN